MSDIVEQAESALAGVSPGPWRCEGSKYVRGWYVITRDGGTAVHATEWSETMAFPADAEFAAAARTLVPALVAEVKSLRWQYAHSGDHMCNECWSEET